MPGATDHTVLAAATPRNPPSHSSVAVGRRTPQQEHEPEADERHDALRERERRHGRARDLGGRPLLLPDDGSQQPHHGNEVDHRGPARERDERHGRAHAYEGEGTCREDERAAALGDGDSCHGADHGHRSGEHALPRPPPGRDRQGHRGPTRSA